MGICIQYQHQADGHSGDAIEVEDDAPIPSVGDTVRCRLCEFAGHTVSVPCLVKNLQYAYLNGKLLFVNVVVAEIPPMGNFGDREMEHNVAI
jgi:hypothetical protein